jgi:hypothetical protein
MIASKQTCFIKQTNIFIERKTMQATTKLSCSRALQCALAYMYHIVIAHALQASKQVFKLRSTTQQMPALVVVENAKFSPRIFHCHNSL